MFKKILAHPREQYYAKSGLFLRFGSLLLLIFILVACQATNTKEDSSNQSELKVAGRSNTQLTLNEAILEQANESGNLIWKISSKKTTYTDDRQIAYLEGVTANLIQEGKIILKLKGNKGEVREQGNLILLEQEIVASDNRNEMILQGNLVEWRPQANLLVMKNKIRGNRLNLSLAASEAIYNTNQESLDLVGKVKVNNREPNLILTSDRLTWQIPQQKLLTNNPVKIVRYAQEQITDRLISNQAIVDLAAKNVTFDQNMELRSSQPVLNVASKSAVWNYEQRTISSDQPIQAVTSQLTVTGNRGRVDLDQEIVSLAQGVEGKTQEQASIFATNAIWTIAKQEIVATGNVIYNKQQPRVDLKGDRAVINLKTNKALVSSSKPQSKPVISVVKQP